MTEGWEYFDARSGSDPTPGDTWDSQQDFSRTAFGRRGPNMRIRTTLPNQALSVYFVGTQFDARTRLDVPDDSDIAQWTVILDDMELPRTAYSVRQRSDNDTAIIVGTGSDTYHNVTYLTGPEFTGSFTYRAGFWNASLLIERYVKREGTR